MIKQIAAATAAMLVAGAACAQDMTSLQDYSCNDGSDLSVAYINAEGGSALAVLLIEGRMHIAPIAVSASGARYVSAADGGYSWHVKRDLGILSRTRDGTDLAAGALYCEERTAPAPRDCNHGVTRGDGVTYMIEDTTKGNERCDLRVPVQAGQEVSAIWMQDSAHMIHILDAKDQALFETFPLTAEEDGELHLRIGLPQSYARRTGAAQPFALAITVK